MSKLWNVTIYKVISITKMLNLREKNFIMKILNKMKSYYNCEKRNTNSNPKIFLLANSNLNSNSNSNWVLYLQRDFFMGKILIYLYLKWQSLIYSLKCENIYNLWIPFIVKKRINPWLSLINWLSSNHSSYFKNIKLLFFLKEINRFGQWPNDFFFVFLNKNRNKLRFLNVRKVIWK